jgi:hypothetical protein
MTIEQMTKLSEATEIASANNDIETLKKIYSIVKNETVQNEENPEGSEWFFSLITSNQSVSIGFQ